MPTISAESPATGVTHEIHFDGEPTDTDIEHAVAAADAPILAVKRRSENSQIEDLLGGEVLNPTTGEKSYSDESRKADENTLKRVAIEKEQDGLRRDAESMADVEKAGKLESALAGAQSAPAGLASLGATALQKAVTAIDPKASEDPRLKPLMSTAPQQFVNDEIATRAAQNPLSGAAGSTATNVAMMGVGGIPNLLSKGLVREAGAELLKAAPINAAVGTGIRAATGQPTTAADLATDAAFGALGGKNPDLTDAAVNAGKTVLKPVGYVADKLKALPEIITGTKDPFELATKALRPANKIGTKWEPEAVTSGLQTIKDLGGENPAVPFTIPKEDGLPGGNTRAFIDAARTTKQRLYGVIKSITGNPEAADVDGAPLIDRVRNAVANDKTLAERPEEVKALTDAMAVYNRPIPLDEAERLLTQTNAELFGPLYNRTAEGKKIASVDLQVQADKAFAEGLREQIDKALEEQLGPAGAKIKKEYGMVSTMEREAEKRYLVALRAAQNSLPEQLAYANSAADIVEGLAHIGTGGKFTLGKLGAGKVRVAVAKHIKELNSQESQIRRIFENLPEGKSPFIQESYPAIPAKPTYSAEDVEFAIKNRKNAMKGTPAAADDAALYEKNTVPDFTGPKLSN